MKNGGNSPPLLSSMSLSAVKKVTKKPSSSPLSGPYINSQFSFSISFVTHKTKRSIVLNASVFSISIQMKFDLLPVVSD